MVESFAIVKMQHIKKYYKIGPYKKNKKYNAMEILWKYYEYMGMHKKKMQIEKYIKKHL